MKRQKLIFIGGPPGVGKTTVAKTVLQRLNHSIRVDGDDLWYHMNPWVINDVTQKMAIKNIQSVLNNFIEAEFSYVILSWVLPQYEIVASILSGLKNHKFEFHFITLTCNENELSLRWVNDGRGQLNDRAKERLKQSKESKGRIIDTTDKNPIEVTKDILSAIGENNS